MDYVVTEINGLEIVKKRKKTTQSKNRITLFTKNFKLFF